MKVLFRGPWEVSGVCPLWFLSAAVGVGTSFIPKPKLLGSADVRLDVSEHGAFAVAAAKEIAAARATHTTRVDKRLSQLGFTEIARMWAAKTQSRAVIAPATLFDRGDVPLAQIAKALTGVQAEPLRRALSQLAELELEAPHGTSPDEAWLNAVVLVGGDVSPSESSTTEVSHPKSGSGSSPHVASTRVRRR